MARTVGCQVDRRERAAGMEPGKDHDSVMSDVSGCVQTQLKAVPDLREAARKWMSGPVLGGRGG